MNGQSSNEQDPKQVIARHALEGTLIIAAQVPLYCPWCGGHISHATKQPLSGWTWSCFGGCNP